MRRFALSILCVVCFWIGALSAEDVQPTRPRICLNMIVKNEHRVILRCLESVRPLITDLVIVDTGSTDNTIELIQGFMEENNIAGEVHERPWVNFAHNRNEALELAKGRADYILIIDADEVLAYEPEFKLPELDKDFYYIMTKFGGTNYMRVQLVKDGLDWKWTGVVHEAIDCPEAKTSGQILHVYNDVHTDGARSTDPRKYYKDAALLEAALEKDPTNKRNMFYLAQSWRDAGEKEKSIEAYQKRVDMGGWDQEVYFSLLQIARLQDDLGYPSEKVIASYYKAHQYRPSRKEPLYYLASYYRRVVGDCHQAYKIATKGYKTAPSNDVLFVENWIDEYGMVMELSIAAYWIGEYVEADIASLYLLAKPDLPKCIRETIERNRHFLSLKLKETEKPLDVPMLAVRCGGV